MGKFFKTDLAIVLLLIAIFFIFLPSFFLRQGLLLIDTGREFYLPQQLNDTGVLYKTVYNIYGAFSYQFNAFLFSVFGEKFITLYFAGIINSIVILVSIFLISREFLNKTFSFLISFLVMFSLVFSPFLYNSNIPYSYAISYALSAFLLSLLFLIKYTKNTNSHCAYIACFLAGMNISSKYEFVFYLPVLLYVILFLNRLKLKELIFSLISFLIVPFISYGSLLIQGLNLQDIVSLIQMFVSLISAPAIKLFFNNVGISQIGKDIVSLFGFLPLINFVLFCISFKKIYSDKSLFVFLLSSILVTAKFFLYLNVAHMGAFIFPVCILAFIVMMVKLNVDKNFLYIFLSMLILFFSVSDYSSLENKNYLLKTSKGNIYTYKKDGEIIDFVSDYVVNNTKITDKVLILPEGCVINFITGRKGDNLYYNLSPLFYNNVFGEEKILSYFKNNLPEYIVILPINNIEYGYEFFGIDYAQNFYEMIIDNYYRVEKNNNTEIFKRKNLK